MRKLLMFWMALTLAVAAVRGAEDEKRSAEAIAKAEKAVKEHLESLKAVGVRIEYVKDSAVESSLPRQYLFTVLFPQFPVGRVPPEGLKASNVLSVDGEGKVTAITDVKQMEKFCRAHLPAAKEESAKKTALRAWLRLSPQFLQDGFYSFALVEDSLKVDGKTASGTVAVMRGGSGTMGVRLTFDDDGKLDAVKEEVKIRRGPRPICQATKLLDPDPLVRRIAEEDLLIMGPAAKDYLNEQRAKASPELQRAIDRIWRRILESERE
jgi:hypothetical protein